MLKKAVSFIMVLSVFSAVSCAGKKETGPVAVSMEQLYTDQGQPVSVRELALEDFSVYLRNVTRCLFSFHPSATLSRTRPR